MAKKYFDKLTEMMADISPEVPGQADLAVKHFFSGAAVYANGRICITLTPAGFALKLPKALRDDLLKEEGAKTLQYFPQGPTKKDYVVLPKRLQEDRRQIGYWVDQSILYVLTLPRPDKK